MDKKPAVKLCKDCRYTSRPFFGWEFAMCSHPSCTDPVSGKGGSYCSVERNYAVLCGKEAKNFEPKEKGWFLWK